MLSLSLSLSLSMTLVSLWSSFPVEREIPSHFYYCGFHFLICSLLNPRRSFLFEVSFYVADERLTFPFLDRMTSEDVDLNADIPFFKCKAPVEGAAGVSCTTIYQCKNFSVYSNSIVIPNSILIMEELHFKYSLITESSLHHSPFSLSQVIC